MSDGSDQRRLSAILAADVVGYTRLMEQDSDGTVAAWKSARTSIIDPTISNHAGRIVKHTGDGFLAEFSTVQDAVTCAVAIQDSLATGPLDFRMGINLGDIIDDGEDIHGEGVNIAARIEALAEPGSICISGLVFEAVRNRVDVVFDDLGEHTVKHVSAPIHVYQITVEGHPDSGSGSGPDLSIPDKPSIAVLPFTNMSGDPEQEFFSDGITEDIITALSRSPWLFIIARNTTFTYKGEKVDVKRVAGELGVRYVLEGSVRRSGERIRVTAQLIDGTTGGHIWSERYDGQLADVFDLQDEITRNVVASIQTQVHLTAGKPVERSNRPDLTVWELTMRAWTLLYKFTPESFSSARALLEQALVHDPESAEANMVLSLIYYHTAVMWEEKNYRTQASTARDFARRATRLDDHNEYAHWALGLTCMPLARHEEAITSLERAVELNPNCSLAYGSLGTALSLVGRVDEAIANQEIAIRSNPRDPSIFFRFTGIALAHYLAGRHDTAVEWAGKSVHRMPQWYFGHFILAASHVRAGREAEAKAAIDSCREALPDASIRQLDRIPLKAAEDMERFRDCLRKAGLPE